MAVDRDGYCKHGQYVGGCGADYICGACEMEGEDSPPTPAAVAARLRKQRASEAVMNKWFRLMNHGPVNEWNRRKHLFHVLRGTDKA